MDVLNDFYDWIKAAHIISVIAWMVGLLYLPRLYVYHTDCVAGSEQARMLEVMERRLLQVIMTPAAIASLILGGLLLLMTFPSPWESGWIYVKTACIIALLALHHQMGRWRRAFVRDENTHSARFYRAVNEGPTILMIIAVIMAVVKPF